MGTHNIAKALKLFFRNKDGQIVIWQWPNIPIYGWLTFKFLSIVTPESLQTGFGLVSNAFLFTWAYLEITQGVNYFRKSLGFIVIILIFASYFK